METTTEASQDALRKNLRTFHRSLSEANYDTIEELLAPDYFWNYDGTIILSSHQARLALEGSVESALHVLFRISGRQTGHFLGLPVQSDGQYNVKSAEKFVFDEHAKARVVHTVTPTGIMIQQMKASLDASSFSQETGLRSSPQTGPKFRELLRRNMRALFLNANAGNSSLIREQAIEEVEVDENGTVAEGREAFHRLVVSENAGVGAFPNKLFHAVDILADGYFGAVEYVWQGVQEKEYRGVPLKKGAGVRMRGMFFFEFNSTGLVTKATAVWNEDVVLATLTGQGGYLYP